MPVTGATTRNDYSASSGQTVFAYTFQILLATDIKVIKNGSVLTFNNDYTVSNVGVAGGGNVTLTSGASSGDTVSVFLAMPIDRTTEYQNAGDFLASDVNGDFDKGYVAMNQLQTDISRSIHLKDQDPSVSMELPVKADRASKFLAFDANGQPIVYTTPSGSGTASTYQPSFTGSVSRSLQARLEDYASVADFGAVGDGVTDDTAALQAAFSYGNTTRTKIVMEGKTYLYSGLLATITDSVEIEGAGDGTILLKDDTYTGAAFIIDNTFGQIPEFYPNSAGDQNLVANLTRVKSPSFSKFSIVGKSRAYAGHGFEFNDRNDMVSIQDVNCFNLKGSAFRFTGTFGNLRESNIRRFVVRMCGDETYPAIDLKMPSFQNTASTSSTVTTDGVAKTRFTLTGTGDNFSGLTGNRRIRVQGSRLDGGTREWPIETVISDTVVELPYDITTNDPETGEPYGQSVTNGPTTFYRNVDGLNHLSFNDCQIVGCYGTYLRLSHDRVNFFRRIVFNNLMVHGSNKKYHDDTQQGPAGDLILLEGGIGSVDFRGLRINNNEVDKTNPASPILYAGVRVRAGQIITQDIPDRVWINDLDMLNLNNDGEAMFVIEKVKNMSVNGTVAASSQSGTELKVLPGSVTVGLDYNVLPGTSRNVRNVGVADAFVVDSSVASKVFITQNRRKDVLVSYYGGGPTSLAGQNTSALENAWNSLKDIGGKIILDKAGTWNFKNTVFPRTNKPIEIEAVDGVVLYPDDPQATTWMWDFQSDTGVTQVSFNNIRVSGQKADNTREEFLGIRVGPSNNLTAYKCFGRYVNGTAWQFLRPHNSEIDMTTFFCGKDGDTDANRFAMMITGILDVPNGQDDVFNDVRLSGTSEKDYYGWVVEGGTILRTTSQLKMHGSAYSKRAFQLHRVAEFDVEITATQRYNKNGFVHFSDAGNGGGITLFQNCTGASLPIRGTAALSNATNLQVYTGDVSGYPAAAPASAIDAYVFDMASQFSGVKCTGLLSPQATVDVPSGNFINGIQYRISDLGPADNAAWVTYTGVSGTYKVGDFFTGTGNSQEPLLGPDVAAGSFVSSTKYRIKTVGSGDWNAYFGTTGVTYEAGHLFTATTNGSGLTGAVVNQAAVVTRRYAMVGLAAPGDEFARPYLGELGQTTQVFDQFLRDERTDSDRELIQEFLPSLDAAKIEQFGSQTPRFRITRLFGQRTANPPATFDRRGQLPAVGAVTYPGDIVSLERGGLKTGGIGVEASADDSQEVTYIESSYETSEQGVGLSFDKDAVLPRKNQARADKVVSLGSADHAFNELFLGDIKILSGTGDPSAGSGTAAPQGSMFLRTDGGASTTLYVKTGGGNTDWTAK